jgi:hypothetical protein
MFCQRDGMGPARAAFGQHSDSTIIFAKISRCKRKSKRAESEFAHKSFAPRFRAEIYDDS